MHSFTCHVHTDQALGRIQVDTLVNSGSEDMPTFIDNARSPASA